MAAWYDRPAELYDRLEANTPDGFDGSVFYDISLDDLCALIDRATESAARLADDLHQITASLAVDDPANGRSEQGDDRPATEGLAA